MKFYPFRALFIVSASPSPYAGPYAHVRTASQPIRSKNSFRISISIIGLRTFWKMKYFGDIPRQLLCIYHKVKIIQKHIFAVLFIHNINPSAEKSSKNWFKMAHETSWSGRFSLSYGILDFAKKCQKDTDLALSAVLEYFPGQISQPRFIQSTWFQGPFRWVLWALSNGYT